MVSQIGQDRQPPRANGPGADSASPPTLDYRPALPPVSIGRQLRLRWSQAMVAYFAISSATLPLLNAVWIGELPPFVIIQVPKIALAGWIRTDIVMPLIRILGLSSGSFSPDYGAARPYALAIAYLLIGGITLVATGRSPTPAMRHWARSALLLGAIDYFMTLWLADGPGLTIY